MKTYEIGGKRYHQKPLVLGQISQIVDILKDLSIPANISPAGVLALMGDRLPRALAVALTPEGVSIKDKDLHAIASEIAFGMEAELALTAVEDFFDCNPLSSLFERMRALNAMFKTEKRETGSSSSASSSPKETSQGETPSSGAAP